MGTCPGDCNGHGVCQSNKDFAEDYARAMATAINLKQRQPRCKNGATAYTAEDCPRNIEHNDDYYKTFMVSYEDAWDSGLQYGCKCDSGYTGGDCSKRECPTSFDPLDSSCEQAIISTTGKTTTKISLTRTNVDDEKLASVWSDLPVARYSSSDGKLTPTKESNKIGDAEGYLALYEQTNIFYQPKEFKTITSHFSDMARRCTAFHVSKSVDDSDLTTFSSGVWSIAPISADSWMCAYMWDSTMVKTPYCAGRWTSLECSGRGICDKTSGTCTCFAGYTGNDCAAVSELG